MFGEQQLSGLEFTSTPENWRRVAHKISDAIYERLTGEKGYFDTRVVFVAESGGLDYARRRGEAYAEEAEEALADLSPGPIRAALTEAIAYVMERRS